MTDWFEGWAALPDRPDARPLLEGAMPSVPDIAPHASGRPWLVGHLDRHQVTLAVVGTVRVAVIGTCPVTATRLSELVGRVRSIADLDAVAPELPGSWHLVASVDGVVRVQGGLVGLRRVFHVRVGGVTIAGDRADMLAALSGEGIDEQALAVRVACAGNTPPPLSDQSYWAGVRGLAPGHYLRMHAEGAATETRWWQPPEPTLPLAVGAGPVREALETAVAARRPATGRLSTDLSGGLDSTALCFLAARTVTPELLTFRWGEADTANDDAVFAGHAAAALPDAEHLILAQSDLPAKFADPGELGDAEAPYRFGRTLARARHDSMLLAGLGSRVHLAGHGGDELFHNSGAYLHTLLRRRPLTAIGRVRAHRALDHWPLGATWSALASNAGVDAWWRRQADGLTDAQQHRRAPHLDWSFPIRTPPWVASATVDTARAALRGVAATAGPLAADRGQHATLSALCTAGPWYRQLTRLFGAAGPRLELPYLDDRVVEAALAVRPDEGSTPWRFKPLLVDAMRGVLPPAIAGRTTKGEFSADVQAGLRRHLPDILAVFADSALAARGLIDVDALRRALLTPHVDWQAVIAMEDLLGCETWLRAAQQTSSPPRRSYARTVAT
ncbi:MAG TPA: asparagine synthase-related protein [Pseudonocardia sp.]|nr:asparagine synthase-related protein [Pseudonocardia sp.]